MNCSLHIVVVSARFVYMHLAIALLGGYTKSLYAEWLMCPELPVGLENRNKTCFQL